MMLPLLCLLSTIQVFALTENEIRESVLNHLPLIEEAIFKFEAEKNEELSAEGAFDHKLIVKSRNRIEDKYDNQYLETTIERSTPWKGLGMVMGHRQGLGHFPAYDGKYWTSGAGEIFAGLSMPLLRNFSIDENRADLGTRKIDTLIAKEQLHLKKNIYLHKALSLFYKFLLESKKIKIRKEILELAENRQLMLEKKFNAGDVEKIKLFDNQRSIDKRKDELLKTELELIKIKAELSLYVRDAQGNPVVDINLQDFEIPTKFSSLEKKNLDQTPQLKILNYEFEKLQIYEKLNDQAKLPGLNLELLGSRELSRNLPYDPQSLQVGIKFDLPFENRKAKGKSLATQYKLKALERQRLYTYQELNRYYDMSLVAIDIGMRRWETTTREYENTVIMAEAEKKRWIQGATDLFIVNLREQDSAESDVKRWTTLYEYHQSTLDAKLYSASF